MYMWTLLSLFRLIKTLASLAQVRRIPQVCRFLCLATIVGLIHQSHQEFLANLKEKGQPIRLTEVQKILPSAFSLNLDRKNPSELLFQQTTEKVNSSEKLEEDVIHQCLEILFFEVASVGK